MSEIKAIVAKFYESLNLKGDEALIRTALAADWILHPAPFGEGSDTDRYLSAVKPVFAAVPDFHIEVNQMLAEDNFVAVRCVVTGTHLGTLFGIAATGRQFSCLAHDFHRVEKGQVVESWHIEDWLAVLMQIGAFPV